MKQIFYKDDFSVILTFEGDNASVPDTDFAGRLYSSADLRGCSIPFGRRSGECQGCEVTDQGLRVVADGHCLLPGELMVEIAYLVPDDTYPDGARAITRRYSTDVALVARPLTDTGCDCPPAQIGVSVEIPWQYIHDTDAYAAIIERLNSRLDEILGPGGGTSATPAKAKTAAQPTGYFKKGLINLGNQHGNVYANQGIAILRFTATSDTTVIDLSKYMSEEQIDDRVKYPILLVQIDERDNFLAGLKRQFGMGNRFDAKLEWPLVTLKTNEGDKCILAVKINEGPTLGTMCNGKLLLSDNDLKMERHYIAPPTMQVAYDKVFFGEKRQRGKFVCENGLRIEMQKRYRRKLGESLTRRGVWKNIGNGRVRNFRIVRLRYHSHSGVCSEWAVFSYRYRDGSIKLKRIN